MARSDERRSNNEQISICPAVDLVANIVTDDNSSDRLRAFRFDGQVAFVHEAKIGKSIQSIAWQANGTFLAVGYSDGSLDFFKTSADKVFDHISAHDDKSGGSNEPQSRRVFWSYHRLRDEPATDLLSLNSHHDFSGLTQRVSYSIPIEEYRPEKLHPKLSPLPRIEHPEKLLPLLHDSDGYSSTAEINTAFAMYEQSAPNAIDILLHVSDGTLDLYLFRQYLLKGYRLCSDKEALLSLSASPNSNSILALCASHQQEQNQVVFHVRPIQLGFLASKLNVLLPAVIQTVTHLGHIKNYLVLCCENIRLIWNQANRLVQRLVDNAQELLQNQEKKNISFEAAIYQLGLTGHCDPALKEWLLDELGERVSQTMHHVFTSLIPSSWLTTYCLLQNVKRMTNALQNAYSQVLSLTHTCLLPALDLLTLQANKLLSFSRTPVLSDAVLCFVQERDILRITSNAEVLRLITRHMLSHASMEFQKFGTFADWFPLVHQLVAAQANESTAQRAEVAEKLYSMTNYQLLLPYLAETLTKSRLNFFLGHDSAKITTRPRRPAQQLKIPLFMKILERHNKQNVQPSVESNEVEIANVLYQSLFISDSIGVVEEAVQRGFNKSISVGPPVPLICSATKQATDIKRRAFERIYSATSDVRMYAEHDGSGSQANNVQGYMVRIALVPDCDKSCVILSSIPLQTLLQSEEEPADLTEIAKGISVHKRFTSFINIVRPEFKAQDLTSWTITKVRVLCNHIVLLAKSKHRGQQQATTALILGNGSFDRHENKPIEWVQCKSWTSADEADHPHDIDVHETVVNDDQSAAGRIGRILVASHAWFNVLSVTQTSQGKVEVKTDN